MKLGSSIQWIIIFFSLPEISDDVIVNSIV